MWPWNYSISGKKLSQEQCVESLMDVLPLPSNCIQAIHLQVQCKVTDRGVKHTATGLQSSNLSGNPVDVSLGQHHIKAFVIKMVGQIKFMYVERQVTQWFLQYMISVMSLIKGSKHLSMHANTEVRGLISSHKRPSSYMFQISLLSEGLNYLLCMSPKSAGTT